MTNQDDNNQEIEKVQDVEVETTKKTSDSDNKKQNDDEYEKVCFIFFSSFCKSYNVNLTDNLSSKNSLRSRSVANFLKTSSIISSL